MHFLVDCHFTLDPPSKIARREGTGNGKLFVWVVLMNCSVLLEHVHKIRSEGATYLLTSVLPFLVMNYTLMTSQPLPVTSGVITGIAFEVPFPAGPLHMYHFNMVSKVVIVFGSEIALLTTVLAFVGVHSADVGSESVSIIEFFGTQTARKLSFPVRVVTHVYVKLQFNSFRSTVITAGEIAWKWM